MGLLGDVIYYYLILDYSSTSYKYAGAKALEKGFDPKGKTGIYLDPDKYSISDVYNSFSEAMKKIPDENTSGFMFTTYHKLKKSNKVEFYEYNNNEDYFIYYKFTFNSIEPGIIEKLTGIKSFDSIAQSKMYLKKIPKNKVFVSLKRL